MTRPIPRFDLKNSCPNCHEPLRLVAMRAATALPDRRHLLVCSSANCSYSAGVDTKNITAGLRKAVGD
jgi:hypothetical protein